MKYLVISDIHGSFYYASKIPEIMKRENTKKLILLGDLYYHGPRNPLPKDYAPMKVAELLNFYQDQIIAIRGNCDAYVDETISSFPFHDSYSLDIQGKKFFFTHGHIYHKKHIPKHVDILVYGHLHTGFIEEHEGVICVNTGSLSLPKNHTLHSYVVIDEEKISLKDIEGNIILEKYF